MKQPLRGKKADRPTRRPATKKPGRVRVSRAKAPSVTAVPRKKTRQAKAPRLIRKAAVPIVFAQLKRRILLVVSLLLMATGAGFLVYPFVPIIKYAIAKPAPVAPYETRLFESVMASVSQSQTDPAAPESGNPGERAAAGQKVARPSKKAVKPKPRDNRLVIPKIGVDVAIVVSPNQEEALAKGIWHIPGTSFPDRGGNTVLSGHRFRFLSGNRTLYLLDKLKKGDPVIIYWKGKEYDYIVRGERIVKPNQVEILDNTNKPRLTIFTCAPLFSTKERLVLIAEPV